MSEVKRYGYLGIVEEEDGEVVKWEDYATLKEQFDFKQNLTEQVVALQKQRDALAAENGALKDSVALLLEDARRVLQVEPNAGTQSRINIALSLLSRAGKDGE